MPHALVGVMAQNTAFAQYFVGQSYMNMLSLE